MDYAFASTQHDRTAHLRKGQWRTPDLKVMVIGGDYVATDRVATDSVATDSAATDSAATDSAATDSAATDSAATDSAATDRVASDGDRGIRWLTVDEAPAGDWAFLGYKGEQGFAAVMVERVPRELTPVSLRVLGPTITADEASLAVHAVGLARWHQTHTHCARCGAVTVMAQAGHTRVCPSCGTEHFPRTDPAVIMLITDDDDRVLLGRQGSWPEGRFSTLAGFVEPGETLDDAVRREVKEEVGIEVGEVTYAGSQPWPFPSSLMLGFFGKALTTDITVDADEIAEARWFSRQEITDLSAAGELFVSPSVSISGWLLNEWHGGEITKAAWN